MVDEHERKHMKTQTKWRRDKMNKMADSQSKIVFLCQA